MAPATDGGKIACLEVWFRHHPPKGDQAMRYEIIRGVARQHAYLLTMLMPSGRDLDHAVQLLRQVMTTASAGIACRPVEDLPAVDPQLLDVVLSSIPD